MAKRSRLANIVFLLVLLLVSVALLFPYSVDRHVESHQTQESHRAQIHRIESHRDQCCPKLVCPICLQIKLHRLTLVLTFSFIGMLLITGISLCASLFIVRFIQTPVQLKIRMNN